MGNALVKLLGTATGDVKIKNNTTADVAAKVIVGREVGLGTRIGACPINTFCNIFIEKHCQN